MSDIKLDIAAVDAIPIDEATPIDSIPIDETRTNPEFVEATKALVKRVALQEAIKKLAANPKRTVDETNDLLNKIIACGQMIY